MTAAAVRTLLQTFLVALVLLGVLLAPRVSETARATTVVPGNQPTWVPAYADRFPGCSPARALGDVVIVGLDGRARRMRFDRAWALTHDDSEASGGWVVGWCPDR